MKSVKMASYISKSITNSSVFIWVVLLVLPGASSAFAQSDHPGILVNNEDKQQIIDKIQRHAWAEEIYSEMVERVDPYVKRHQNNPEWILSRYQMNWKEGAYYTGHLSDPSGTEMIGWSGDAPYPTVRVSTHKRSPIAPDGYRYRVPSLEEVVPYDTSAVWRMQSSGPDGEWSEAEPRRVVGNINSRINRLALESAIIYWLTGDEHYAAFASDILFQWARGAYFQDPVRGACRNGFLGIQSLGDRQYDTLVLAYDFVHDYMNAPDSGYGTRYFQPVFEKMARTAMERGFWTNNWYAAQSTTMVYAAFALEDTTKQAYYLDYFLEKDYKNGNCGQLGLPSTLQEHFTYDGHWKENPGYHAMPVGHLMESAIAAENNGHAVFQKYPAIFQASYAMLKYSFPNLQIMGYGDIGGYKHPSPHNLEIAVRFASEYNDPALSGLTTSLNQLIRAGKYRRGDSGWHGLLTYLPELPEAEKETFEWKRPIAVDFSRVYGHRNGTDAEHGLMHYVQGATYNHNNANGMAMELYGNGFVMGADPGTASYEEEVFVNYYAVFAAHNTMIAAGASEPALPFRGSGGAKHMGEINLSVMEPGAGEDALSPSHSFTETTYREPSTDTNQQRTLAIVRTSEKSGYYVDFFRSDNPISNDYLYHNIGHEVTLSDLPQREPVDMKSGVIPFRTDRQTGMEWFDKIATPASSAGGNMVAVFKVKEETRENAYMQMFMDSEPGDTVFTAEGPRTRTAPGRLKDLPTPAVIVHRAGPAWEEPFAHVYEPFRGENGYSVLSARKIDTPSSLAVLAVENRDGSHQYILQSDQPLTEQKADHMSISGHYGVISLTGDDELQSFYLGNGEALHWKDYSVTSKNSASGIFVMLEGDRITASGRSAFTMTFPYRMQEILDEQGNRVDMEIEGNRSIVTFKSGMNKQYKVVR